MSLTGAINKPSTVSNKAEVQPNSFTDIMSKTYNQTVLNFNSTSRMNAMGEANGKQRKAYEDATGTSFDSLRDTEDFKDRLGGVTNPSVEQVNDATQYALEQKKGDPEFSEQLKDVPAGQSSLIALAQETANMSTEEMQEAEFYTNSNWGGTAGFLGGAGASFEDPFMLSTMFMGAPFGSTVLKTVGIEMAIGAGSEAVLQPAIMSWQKELGQEYGLGDAASAVAMSAALSGLIVAPVAAATRKGAVRQMKEMELQNELELNTYLGDAEVDSYLKTTKADNQFTIKWNEFSEVDAAAGSPYLFTNIPTGFTQLTRAASMEDIPASLKADYREAARQSVARASMPDTSPTLNKYQIHAANMVDAGKAMDRWKSSELPSAHIAFERFSAIDTNAHVNFLEEARSQKIDISDGLALDGLITSKLRNGLEEEKDLLMSSTLPPAEFKALKAEMVRLQDEIDPVIDFDASTYSTGVQGKRGASDQPDMRRIEKGATEFIEDRQRVKKRIAGMKQRLKESTNNKQKANDIKKILNGKDVPESMRPMYDEISTSMRKLADEESYVDADSLNVTVSNLKTFSPMMDTLVTPVARTPDEVMKGVESSKPLTTDVKTSELIGEIDKLPDSTMVYNNAEELVSLGELRKTWDNDQKINDIMSACSIGGK